MKHVLYVRHTKFFAGANENILALLLEAKIVLFRLKKTKTIKYRNSVKMLT